MHGTVPAHRRDRDGIGIERRRGRRCDGFEPRRGRCERFNRGRMRRRRSRRRRHSWRPRGDHSCAGFEVPRRRSFVRRQHRIRRCFPRRRARHGFRRGFRRRGCAQDPTHAEDPVRGARGGAADDERDSAAFDHGLWARSRRSPSRVDDGVVAVVQLTLVSGVDDGGRSTGAGADEFDDGGR